jgi:hypothetical protein
VIIVLATGVPAVTSVSEIVYEVAEGTAVKTNGALERTPLPVGLMGVGAVAGAWPTKKFKAVLEGPVPAVVVAATDHV